MNKHCSLFLLLAICASCSTYSDTSQENPGQSSDLQALDFLKQDRHDGRGAVSPDGNKFAFISRDTEGRQNYGLYVVGSNGEDLRQLFFDKENFVKAPDWSPDGEKIAFSLTVGEEVDIYLINADGTDLQLLTPGPGWDAEPCWSPNGDEIAFHSNRSGKFQLYLMDPDGKNQRLLVESNANDYIPDWSSDNRIAFTSDRAGTQDIWTMNLDGSDLKQVTDFPEREISPVWSPDGSTIAFHRNTKSLVSGRTWNWDVYLIDDEQDIHRITSDPGEDLFPNWYPEGVKLLFNSERIGRFRLHSVDVDEVPDSYSFIPITINEK